MTARPIGHQALGLAAWALVIVVILLAVVLPLRVDAIQLGSSFAGVVATLGFVAVGPVFAVTSAVIIGRDPSNSVGWTMMLIALGISFGSLFEAAVPAEAPADPGLFYLVFLGIGSVSWVFFIFPVFHLLLTFPNGRLLSARWRGLVVFELLIAGYMCFFATFSTRIGPIDVPGADWWVPNPIGFLVEDDFSPGLLLGGVLTLAVGGLAAMIVRFIRSRGVERQQMKVLLYAVSLFVSTYSWGGIAEGGGSSPLFELLLPFSIVGVGLAVAFAILRYRLYDIDRVISRTVAYGLIVGLLAAAFFGIAAVVGSRVSEDPLFIAGGTLAAAALFNPMRRLVQRWVDRRFNRSRYDATRVIGDFVGALQERVDPGGVVDGWVDVTNSTMQPAALGVWVRGL